MKNIEEPGSGWHYSTVFNKCRILIYFSVCSHSDIVHIQARLSERKQLGSTKQSEWQNVSKCVFSSDCFPFSKWNQNESDKLLARLLGPYLSSMQRMPDWSSSSSRLWGIQWGASWNSLRSQGLVPSVLGNLATVLSDWHHVSFTIRVAIGNSADF